MISYLSIFHRSQFVSHDQLAHLLDLIRLGFGAFRLEVQDLPNPSAGENVMTSADSPVEAKVPEEITQSLEGDVVIGGTPEDLCQELIVATHDASAPASCERPGCSELPH